MQENTVLFLKTSLMTGSKLLVNILLVFIFFVYHYCKFFWLKNFCHTKAKERIFLDACGCNNFRNNIHTKNLNRWQIETILCKNHGLKRVLKLHSYFYSGFANGLANINKTNSDQMCFLWLDPQSYFYSDVRRCTTHLLSRDTANFIYWICILLRHE